MREKVKVLTKNRDVLAENIDVRGENCDVQTANVLVRTCNFDALGVKLYQTKRNNIWTDDMGDVLKMNAAAATQTASLTSSEMSPSLKIMKVQGNQVTVNAKKQGTDGIEFQYRIAGATVWQPLVNSGDADTVLEIPTANDAAQKIEIRAIYLKNFKRVGDWSSTYNVAVG